MAPDMDDRAVIQQALAEMYELKADIKAKEERVAELAAFFKGYDEFENPGKYQYGDYTLVVSPNTRVDDALAHSVVGDRTYAKVSKVVIDTTKAKKMLTGEQYESIQKKFAHRIGVEKH